MRFFNLYTDEGKKKKFAYGIETEVGKPGEVVDCKDCRRQWRKIPEYNNLTIVLTNNHYPDFMRLSGVNIVLSVKAKEVLEEEHVSGYSLKDMTTTSPRNTPIEFQKLLRAAEENIKKMPENPPTYYKWEITGNAALHEKSGLDVVSCSACGYSNITTPGRTIVVPDHPKIIDKISWDGSDLFRLKYISKYCCSERFYEIYLKHQLTGLEFKEIPSI